MPKTRCKREGCERTVRNPRYEFCTYVCNVLHAEFDKAQRLCEAAGPGTLTTELWSTLVEINDAWTRYLSVAAQVWRMAQGTETPTGTTLPRG